MSNITEHEFARIITLPIALPQTSLPPGQTVAVFSHRLSFGQRLSIRWATLGIVNADYEDVDVTKLNSNLGLIYAGIYAGIYIPTQPPNGDPIASVVLDGVGYAQLNPFTLWNFVSPDDYYFVVANNTNRTFHAVLTGAAQLYYA